jgi:hypothetical protein
MTSSRNQQISRTITAATSSCRCIERALRFFRFSRYQLASVHCAEASQQLQHHQTAADGAYSSRA